MAERRMFAKSVIDSDSFVDMPLTAQALYFHMGMRADDDGFIDSPRKIQRAIGCSADDMKLLIAKGFLIAFDSGVVVIRHWRAHNYIRSDRYKKTVYEKELAELQTNANGTYCLVGIPSDNQLSTNCIPSDNQAATNGCHRLGKERLEKSNNIIYSASDTAKSTGFEAVWAVYPRKKDKGAARKAYEARVKDGWAPDELRGAAQAYAAECRKERREEKFIKHGSTFFGAATPFADYVTKTTGNDADDLEGIL